MTLRPPGGTPPPELAVIDGRRFDLRALAGEIAERYVAEYPDEAARYGPAGKDWCRHDNQWVLRWAVDDSGSDGLLDGQVSWLARVLHARAFPLERLARSLQIAAEVVEPEGLGPASATVAERLRAAARMVAELRPVSAAPGA